MVRTPPEHPKPATVAPILTATLAVSEPPDAVSVNIDIHTPLSEHHPASAFIGQVANEWAHFEHALDLIIYGLAGIPHDIGACITGQLMGATPRFNAIIALATRSRRNSSTIEKVRGLLQKTYDVQEARNRAIHDPWYLKTNPASELGQFRSMPKKELYYGIKPVREEEIKALVEKIRKLRVTALDILRELR